MIEFDYYEGLLTEKFEQECEENKENMVDYPEFYYG